MNRVLRGSQLPRLIILVLYAGVAAYSLLYMLHDVVGLSRWQKSGYLESRLGPATDSIAVFRKAIQNDFVSAPFPTAGDSVLEVAGRPMIKEWRVQFGPTVKYDVKPFPAGIELPLTYLHNGDTLHTAFAMHPPTTKLKWFLILVDVLRHLIVLSMLAVGGWGVYTRGETLVVQVFALYCLTRAAEAVGSYFIPLSFGLFPHPLIYPLSNSLPYIVSTGIVSLWLHLQFVFPKPLVWVKRHPWVSYALCYIPTFLALLAFLSRTVPFVADRLPFLVTYGEFAEQINWAFLILGVVILVFRYNTSTDRVEQRQLRLFIGGSALGLVASAILSVLYAFWFDWYDSSPYIDLIGSAVVYVATLLGPVSFVYAFRRYRLMDIEGKLRRGTRYALVGGVILTGLAGVVLVISRIALQVTGLDSTTLSLAIGFGLSLTILPAQRRMNTFLEKRLYPERARLRTSIHDFLHRGATPVDQHEFWNSLTNILTNGMKVQYALVLRLNSDEHPLTADSAIVRHLARNGRALLVDEAPAIPDIESDSVPLAWLRERRVGILVPLMFRDHLRALIAIGPRLDEEDYDSEELQILNSVAPQIAVTAENLRLIEENFDKKRLESELASARTTQMGLLPQGIPDCRGLEIAAACHFCLEVAGDYYDIVPLDNGQTCIAIGDVSGKGASASLLMASLQSSLNTAIPFGIALSDIVGRINKVVCRNTSADQFITFFIGVFDPQTSVLSYVNAGHDEPVLTRADGTQELLDQGGVLLGFIPGWKYIEGKVQLHSADTLLLYTDGVREARSPLDEEYGLLRLSGFASAKRSLSGDEQLRLLESDVISFHGSDRFDDDFTLLLLKVK